ncbi:MAG: hypothetical protein V2A65_08990 [Candidatus Omnitrophota bacterium]
MKKGRIKSGEGVLIGNAGEYYVMGELLKRGVIAALAPRNAPSFDILATNKKNRAINIRVKTKSGELPIWQYSIKKDGEIFHNLSRENDFTVLVDLGRNTREMKFYVVPTHVIDVWLRKDFEIWRDTPGKNGHLRSRTMIKRILSEKIHAQELRKHLDGWDDLWR